jgi:anion-transporting  ArsA/GET3 family ATPase
MKKKFEDSDFEFDEEATLDKINEHLKSPCAAEKAIREHLVSILSQDYDLKVFDMDPTGDALKIIDKLMNSDSHEKLENNSVFGIATFPEKSPVEEATRTIQHLSEKYGLENSFLIVNYLLPQPENDFMKVKKNQQASYLKELEERIERPMIGFKEESGNLDRQEDLEALIGNSR